MLTQQVSQRDKKRSERTRESARAIRKKSIEIYSVQNMQPMLLLHILL